MNSVFFPICVGIGMIGAALTYAIAGPSILLQGLTIVTLAVAMLLYLASRDVD